MYEGTEEKNEWKSILVRRVKCCDCGTEFTLTLGEFISKLDSGMRLPRRCRACRRRKREHPDPYAGLFGTMFSYPVTKGHGNKVHGGYCNVR